MSWDEIYRQAETVWGERPDWMLIDIAASVPPGRVLDLGMGEGRNGMFFAQRGYDVRGVDSSPAAVTKCQERAQSLRLPFQAEVGDMRTVVIEPYSLSLVICAMALQFIKRSESQVLIQRIMLGLKPGGMVYITTYSTDDPWYARLSAAKPEVETRTFARDAQNGYVHFFEKAELPASFSNLKLVHFSQTLSLDRGHPGAPEPHYHGTLTYIGQKEGTNSHA